MSVCGGVGKEREWTMYKCSGNVLKGKKSYSHEMSKIHGLSHLCKVYDTAQ